ncbi:Cytosolic phospholipase A2 gamma [Anabarilius grahami]|uniref:Cytosolic phospholipase A2 gamma n=1 Tax=Anabarilius grahami TaxID=495550 RepID=A0A3N0YHT3_ANAGA|nr:Cytosolic phospholipase A2 gamma [Anabarilius grahami]
MSGGKRSKCDCEVRIGHSLNEAEKNHVTSRRESALECLKKHGIHCSLDKLPNIALLASGGGERAMVGLLGSLVALSKNDLLDCMLYLAGISGSTWCMASLYKEPNWSSNLEAVKDDFVQILLQPAVSFKKKLLTLKKYYRQKDNFSLTDIWAVLVLSKIVKKGVRRQTLDFLEGGLATARLNLPFFILGGSGRLLKLWIQHYLRMETLVDRHLVELDHYSLRGNTESAVSSAASACLQSVPISQLACSCNLLDCRALISQLAGRCQLAYRARSQLDPLRGFFDEKFVEITPHETGYSIPGAFVDTSCFGSHFDQGVKIKDQPEMDMLFLQGLCGSFLADLEKILEELLPLIKMLMLHELDMIGGIASSEIKQTDIHSFSDPHVDEAGEVLLTLVELNLLVLRKEDPSSHIQILNNLLSAYENPSLNVGNEIWTVIVKCIELVTRWIWGTTYNFLYNMAAEEVSPSILKEEKRHYVDAGIDNNSPFLPVLRKERHIDIILSLDFSETDPFKSLIKTVDMCKDLHIDFPEVPNDLDDERDDPKDFYVFEGPNAPTVIHIPLFNKTNCGDKEEIGKWRKTYKTFQLPYDKKMIDDLLEKAGMNIKDNKENLLTEIQKVIKRKTS